MASIYTLNPGTDILASPSLFPTGGTLVGSNAIFFSTGTLDGDLTSLVYQGDPSNPYHGLTFTYSISLLGDSTDNLSKLTVGSYGGFLTDVSYNSASGGLAPSDFSRTAGNGPVLQFAFGNGGGIAPGGSGATIVVQSSALNFQVGMGAVIDSLSTNVAVLTPIPEPSIGSLVATGLGALLLWHHRSRNVRI